jgi:hypothetical protein
MNELIESIDLAEKILDRNFADPDDDLAILARRVKRSREQIIAFRDLVCNVAQILDVVKREWGESWSAWDQEQRDKITELLMGTKDY